MFDVLAFVYETYGQDHAYPEPLQLGVKLNTAGFEPEAVEQALAWLDGLAEHGNPAPPPDPTGLAASAGSLRVYSVAEQQQFEPQALGFVCFLSAAGLLNDLLRELVLERAMAIPQPPLGLAELRLVILLIHWRCGIRPDTWLLETLRSEHPEGLRH